MHGGALRDFYLVCANPRVGSTFFCEVLKATGVAGHITEPFDPNAEARLRREWDFRLGSRSGFICRAIESSRTPNGVGGAKIMWAYLDRFLSDLSDFDQLAALPSDLDRFAAVFGGCHAVHLSRRNKVRAAISYWLASVTGEWFWDGKAARPPLPTTDVWKITRLHAELHAAEISWPLILRAANVHSSTIYYEDWVADPVKQVLRIANQDLHLPVSLADAPASIALARQANERTDEIERQWTALTGGCPTCVEDAAVGARAGSPLNKHGR